MNCRSLCGLLLISLLAFGQGLQAQTPQFSFANNTTASNSIPFGGGTWSDQRNQWFWAPGDFGNNVPGGQAIKTIYFKAGSTQATVTTFTNLVIKLGQPNVTGLTTTFLNTSNFVTVFSRASYQVGATTQDQWWAIELDIPFAFDPSMPLVMETIQTATTNGKALRAGGDPLNPAYTGNTQTYGASGATTGSSRPYSYALGLDLISLAPINAGVVEITEPVNFCPGTYDVKAKIRNSGTQQLDSVRVDWSIDGSAQNTIYYTTLLDTFGGSGSNTAIITLGSLNFTAGNPKTIKVWTSYPNGAVDSVNLDDTVTKVLMPSLSGTFTIGGGGADYPTFTAAVDDLNNFGVCGPVVFNVNAGTFTERVIINQVPGASATNTISFIGSGIGSTIVTNAGTSTANMITILLNGADYISFRDMTIRGTGASYGVGILLTAQADYNRFDNLHIQMNNTSSAATTCGIAGTGSLTSVTSTGNNANYNWIDSCIITGAYSGVTFYGTSSSGAHCFGNRVTNCDISSVYYHGIRFYYQNESELDRNKIYNMRNTTQYGLYVYYNSDYLVTNNEVSSTYGALYLYYSDRYLMSGNFTSLVANNILKAGTYYGIYCYYTYDANIYHNTVYSDDPDGSAYFYYANNVDCRNNIFVNTNTSATGYVVYITNGSQSDFDYNVYHTSGGTFVYHDAAYSSFDSWKQGAPFINLNSQELEPVFASATDLHLDQDLAFPRAPIVAGIDTDVDGDPRCELAATVGADESNFATPSPTAAIAMSDTIYVSSPTTFFSANQPLANVLWDYTWYVDGVQKGTTLDLDYTFGSTGNYQVVLRARSCSGSDRDTAVVNVVNPTSSPVTDFSANKLVLDILEPAHLTDLSDFGATQWEWTAEPSFDALFSDAYASDPLIYFTEPGSYKICLTTWNALGQGNTLCKDAYIKVNDDASMCSASGSTYDAGRLTDEGGPTGNYNANTSCNFLIHPCAGEVVLRFTQWNLSDADDELRVYDGEDNTGTLLGVFNGTSGLPGGNNGLIASTGVMYLEWNTSPAGQSAGFTAYWTSTPDPNAPKPVADFTGPDTVWTNIPAEFVSTSTGSTLSYVWDFDAPNGVPGLDGGDGETDRFVWTGTGVYPVSLMVYNCGGGDTIQKFISVYTPTTKPVVGFYASRTKAPVLSTVTLFDSSFQGGTSWKWTITPANTTNLLSPDTDQNIQVTFLKSGTYTVKLKVGNAIGEDSLTKTAYIEVFDYCAPLVGSLSSDVAISRVTLRSIDNYSTVGTSKYTSYLDNVAPVELALRDSVEISIERQTVSDPMSRKVWIDWNNDGDFTDAGELVAYETAAKTLKFTTRFAVPGNAVLGYTTLRVGVSYNNDLNAPCGINPIGEFEDYPVRIIIDNNAPVITLTGLPTVYVEQGYSYVDDGAGAWDLVDGDLSGIMTIINPVDSSTVGSYTVRYNVTDLDGNAAAEVTRTVIVTPDVTRPVITLNGPATVTVTVMTGYTDAGATATDYYLKDLTPELHFGDNLNLNALGTYYYWYTVEDLAGNKDSVAREVVVIDDVPPVLQLFGPDPLVLDVWSPINDPGYTVGDNHSATIDVIVDSSQVNTGVLGTYPLIYTAMDESGNVTTVTRTIIVEDQIAPVITLLGLDTVYVDVFRTYTEAGVKVTDNFCQNLGWQVDQQPNTAVLGEYILTYTAEDCNGNPAMAATRVVRVVDRKAPLLTLNGFANVSMYRWQSYTDPGVSIDDNYYDESILQPLVEVTSNLDPNWPGFYTICYQVTDPSDNTSNTVCRSVRVLESVTGIEDPEAASLKAYPNPGRGVITVEGDILQGNEVLVVRDMNGREVYRQTNRTAGSASMDLSGLSAGVYVVVVEAEDRLQTIRIQITQ